MISRPSSVLSVTLNKYGRLVKTISFVVSWPSLDRASNRHCPRHRLDGDHYGHLTPAVAALAAKYPLAATQLLRAMIDFSLTRSRASRYGHAARLGDCAGLASAIEDYASFEGHDAYVGRLRRDHARKSVFWGVVS
jgi:Family of unknown function (DUF6880)